VSGYSYGYGVRKARLHVMRQSEWPRARQEFAGKGLVFHRVPEVKEFLRLVGASDPAFCVLPNCSPYSHLAASLWLCKAPTMLIDAPEELPRAGFASVDFDNELLVVAECEAEVEMVGSLHRSPEFKALQLGPVPIEVLIEPSAAADVDASIRNYADGLSVVRADQLLLADGTLDLQLLEALRARQIEETIYVRFFDPDSVNISSRKCPQVPQPSLGYRGIRILEIDGAWVEKFHAATELLDPEKTVVVAPMVTSAQELVRLANLLGPRYQRIGVTIETPAAAVCCSTLLRHAEFVQIGLNDLTQYTMAWDRDVPQEERLPRNHIAPPVAALIKTVAASCSAHGVRYTLGLDLRPAADLAAQIRGLGVTSISCARALARPWKQAFSRL